ncbi:unnamed protein product, partial [Meganyctiphanes norvegica]
INTQVAVAIFRFITVCKPQFKSLLTPSLARKFLALVYCHTLSFTLYPLFGWSKYVKEPFHVSCSTDWHDRTPAGVAFSISMIVGCFCTHVLILIICYYKIFSRSRELQLHPRETNPRMIFEQEEEDKKGVNCCDKCVCVCEVSTPTVDAHVLW